MNMNLTKLVVERAEAPATGQTFIRDDTMRGLALRISAGGHKTFVFEGRVKGRVRRMTLGEWPHMNVAGARDKVMGIRAAIAEGRDPASDRIEARNEPTFGELVDDYLLNAETRKFRSLKTAKLRIEKYLSSWRNRQASDITVADVAALHQRLAERGRVLANRVVSLTRAIFNYGISLKKFKGDNPAEAVEMFAEQSRERFLSVAEMERVNAALLAEPHPYWKVYFAALLTLGMRKSELLKARWSDIDLDARTIRLPMTKNGRSHVLPIAEETLQMLMTLPSFERRNEREGWIFLSAGGRSPEGHLTDPLKAWERIRNAAGVPDVTVHDLRRTLGSWMAAQGDSLLLIGRALNHQSSSSTQIYARLSNDSLREAIERNAARMRNAVAISGK
jgi:integrase